MSDYKHLLNASREARDRMAGQSGSAGSWDAAHARVLGSGSGTSATPKSPTASSAKQPGAGPSGGGGWDEAAKRVGAGQ